jgi:hypothetical protein
VHQETERLKLFTEEARPDGISAGRDGMESLIAIVTGSLMALPRREPAKPHVRDRAGG